LPIKADLYSLFFVSYVLEERMSILLAQNKEKIAKSFRKHSTKMEEAIADLRYASEDFVPSELPEKIVVDQDFLAYSKHFLIQKRSEYQGSLLMIWICQTVLVCLIFAESIAPGDNEEFQALSNYPDGVMLVMARFICGIVLHMSLQSEMK